MSNVLIVHELQIFASKINGQFAPASGGQFNRHTQNTDNHDLYLSETFFKIIGFNENDDKLYEEYINRSKKVIDMNIVEYPKELDGMVYDIYKWLMKEKTKHV